MTAATNCLFCQIISGQIPAKKVLENESVVAFWNSNPVAEYHFLVTPKKHIVGLETIGEDDKEDLLALFQAVQQLNLDNDLAGGYKLVINGEKLRHVGHLHFHLLGGKVRSHP